MSAGVRVLVVVASRHGSTAELGRELARALTAPEGRPEKLAAVAIPAAQLPDPSAFDGVVLGSAVYAGRWLDHALEYAAHHAVALRLRPVWLFSSGPIGEPPFPDEEPHDVAPISALTGARAHRVFPGRLDLSLLNFGERAMATAMRAPVGDFRDWDAVTAWAAEIAEELIGRPVPVAERGASLDRGT